jgi:hypothetical protein
MNNLAIDQTLPSVLEKVVQSNLAPGETVLVRLKGAFKEALVCTDRRVMIVKSGFMTGQMFGSDVFQVPYSNIASAEVKYRILSGYFEVTAGGMQNTPKSYWSQQKGVDPAKAPNCISLNSKSQADSFRAACALIMERIEQTRRGIPMQPASSETDVATALERLWKLKTDGAIDQAEYDTAKGRLLAKSGT